METKGSRERRRTLPPPTQLSTAAKSYTRHFLSDALGARWRRTPSAPQHRRVPAARNHCSHQPSRPSAANHTHCSRSDRWLKVHRAGPNENRARFTQQPCSAGRMRSLATVCIQARASPWKRQSSEVRVRAPHITRRERIFAFLSPSLFRSLVGPRIDFADRCLVAAAEAR